MLDIAEEDDFKREDDDTGAKCGSCFYQTARALANGSVLYARNGPL